MWSLETLGRVRLSKYFYMRDMLHSEIGNFYGVPNIPEDPDLAIAAGARLAQELLDPLQETFGSIAIRSAYRSAALNAFGNDRKLNCGGNEGNRGVHIWDQRDADGNMGACACIVVPWFADQYDKGRDWRDLAWWVHDHLTYSQMLFFPKLAAFNLTWNEVPLRAIRSWIKPHHLVLRGGEEPEEALDVRQARYADFPPFRGIAQPPIPPRWA
ncbi:hypothetical protein KVX96_06710 [Pseudoruegeria sp. SHC-113]|nr:hypothetical protein [Pseudoruegeria sp. SHC-113]